MNLTVIGVDPGRTTGIALLAEGCTELVQCTPGAVLGIVRALGDGPLSSGLLIAVERFVVSTRAGRSSDARAGAITRELIGALAAMADPELGVKVVLRSASEVKPWATDARLAARGIATRGMPHALDAARHALFAAVKDGGLPDPLSARKRGR